MPANANIDRRAALSSFAALGALALASPAARAAQNAPAKPADEPIGWSNAKSQYILPTLPYDYDALEPHIDAQTMTIHHTKHHAGYVRGANNALAKLADIREGSADPALIKHYSRELSFHLSGHANHTLFWHVMAPPSRGGGGEPNGTLASAINHSFGSFNAFSAHFQSAAKSVEASGWGWLAFDPTSRRLLILQGEKQQNLLATGLRPILGVDVWEHAYYLKYQNRRADYINAFMNVINWNAVAAMHDAATA